MDIPPPGQCIDIRLLDRLPWAYTTSRLRVFEHDFAVRTLDPALGRYLERVFSPFIIPGQPHQLYSFLRHSEHSQMRYSLFYGSERLQTSSSAPFVFSLLLWHINRQAIESCENYLLVHAAAAEFEGHALLFPAPMESGKTTLVAGLVRAGLRYLTDEAAAIDPRTLQVHPFPKALSIDIGSWEVLANLKPEVEREVQLYLGRQWQVDPQAIRADAVAPPSFPRFVIIPSYKRGACSELVRLRPAQALLALCENSFNLNTYRAVGLQALTAIVKQSECYRLMMGNLDAACALVLRLLAVTRQEG
jgi:hypothetical protein